MCDQGPNLLKNGRRFEATRCGVGCRFEGREKVKNPREEQCNKGEKRQAKQAVHVALCPCYFQPFPTPRSDAPAQEYMHLHAHAVSLQNDTSFLEDSSPGQRSLCLFTTLTVFHCSFALFVQTRHEKVLMISCP